MTHRKPLQDGKMTAMPGPRGRPPKTPRSSQRDSKATRSPYRTGSRRHTCASSSLQTPRHKGVSQRDGPALTEPSPQSMPRLPKCVHRPRIHSGPTRNVNATGTEHHPSPEQPSAQQHRPQGPSGLAALSQQQHVSTWLGHVGPAWPWLWPCLQAG